MHDVFRSLIQCPASVFTEAPISWPEKTLGTIKNKQQAHVTKYGICQRFQITCTSMYSIIFPVSSSRLFRSPSGLHCQKACIKAVTKIRNDVDFFIRSDTEQFAQFVLRVHKLVQEP